MTPRILIDASSAILLVRAGLIRPCCEAFTVCMTRSVFNEVTVPARAGADRLRALAERQPGFSVLDHPISASSDAIAADLKRLHRGERDTLHHYLNDAARFVVIDDRKGVQACRRLNIPHVNALLCPKLLFFSGRILDPRQAQTFLRRIASLGRYSKDVVTWAQHCRRADLDFFIGRDEIVN